jgi:hypothetical protein
MNNTISIEYDDGDCRSQKMSIYGRRLEARFDGSEVVLLIGDAAIHLHGARWIEVDGVEYKLGDEDAIFMDGDRFEVDQ